MPALLVGLAYLSGSIPFGVIVTKAWANKDVRASGSGNIGATNVARVAGKKLGALVLLLDAAKGALPVGLAVWVTPESHLLHSVVGFVAFLGHVFPVWLAFRGGKGVATALGVLTVLLPLSAVVGLVVWGALVAITRVSSVGSLAAGVCAVAVAFAVGRPLEYSLLAVILLVGMLLTHLGNIRRLVARRENRL